MNETIKSLLERRSVRSFISAPVSDADLELIIKCGFYAATARNLQPWHFAVVTNTAFLDEMVEAFLDFAKAAGGPLSEMANRPGFHNFYHAPAVIFVFGKSDAVFKASDCGGAAQNMAVAAYSLGLGSCIVANIMPLLKDSRGRSFIEKMNVPEGYEPMLSVAVGHAASPYPGAPERNLNAVSYLR